MHNAVLVGSETHLTRLGVVDGAFDVRSNSTGLGIRHQTTGTENLPQLAHDTHRVGRGDHDVKVHHAALDLVGKLFHADKVSARGFGLLGILALGEDSNTNL